MYSNNRLSEHFLSNPLEKDAHGCMPNAPEPAKTLWCEAVNMCISTDHYDSQGCTGIIEMIKYKASGVNDSLLIFVIIGIFLYFYFSKGFNI